MSVHRCVHVANGVYPPTTRTTMEALPASKAFREEFPETELCVVCSGLLVAVLARLERGGTVALARAVRDV